MEFIRNELQETIRSSAVDFAQNYLKPRVEEIETAEQFPEDLFHIMADMGFLSLSYPESYGGLGAGYLTLRKLPACLPAPRRCLPCVCYPWTPSTFSAPRRRSRNIWSPVSKALTVAPWPLQSRVPAPTPSSSPQLPKGGTENISSAGPSALSPTPPTRGLSSSWPVTRAPTPVRPISSKNSARGIPSPSPGTKLDFMEAMSMMSSWTM